MNNVFIRFSIFLLIIFYEAMYGNDDFDYKIIKTNDISLEVKNYASGFDIPWGMAFLPDTSMLVTDLSGMLFRVYQDGSKDIIDGVLLEITEVHAPIICCIVWIQVTFTLIPELCKSLMISTVDSPLGSTIGILT